MTPIFDDEPTIPVNRDAGQQDDGQKAQPAPEWMQDMPVESDHALGLAIYRSDLLNAASELIALILAMPRMSAPLDGESVRQVLVDKLVRFRQQGLFLDYHPSVIDKSCFVLAAALDEVILHSSWGESLSWENESLLSRVFNQRNGGEVFYDLLEQARLQPGKLVDFLELQYVILCTGFLGRYRNQETPGAGSAIAQYKAELYELVQHYRPQATMPESSDSSHVPWNKPKPLFHLARWWISAIILMVSASLASWFFYHREEAVLIEEFHTFSDMPLPPLIDVKPPPVPKKPAMAPPVAMQKPIVHKPVPTPASGYRWEVILGSFRQQSNLEELKQQVEKRGYSTQSKRFGQYHVLFIPVASSRQQAINIQNKVNEAFSLGAFIRENQ